MSGQLEFLAVDAADAGARFAPIARSPMEAQALAAGARMEVRDGWNVAVSYENAAAEREALATAAGWCDRSHLGKLELQCDGADAGAIVARACEQEGTAAPALELGQASVAAGAWWCPLAPGRVLALCPPAATAGLRERLSAAAAAAPRPASVTEVTTLFAGLTIAGPDAREVIARFCALDLRPASLPLRGVAPGSVARTPGLLVREGEERFLILFGWALGEYVWSVVEDAGRHLGARAVGADALASLDAGAEPVAAHA